MWNEVKLGVVRCSDLLFNLKVLLGIRPFGWMAAQICLVSVARPDGRLQQDVDTVYTGMSSTRIRDQMFFSEDKVKMETENGQEEKLPFAVLFYRTFYATLWPRNLDIGSGKWHLSQCDCDPDAGPKPVSVSPVTIGTVISTCHVVHSAALFMTEFGFLYLILKLSGKQINFVFSYIEAAMLGFEVGLGKKWQTSQL